MAMVVLGERLVHTLAYMALQRLQGRWRSRHQAWVYESSNEHKTESASRESWLLTGMLLQRATQLVMQHWSILVTPTILGKKFGMLSEEWAQPCVLWLEA